MIPKIKLAGIYLICHRDTGMFYLGKSVDIFSRWSTHYYDLRLNRHSSNKFQLLWNQSIPEDWDWSVIKYQSIAEYRKENPMVLPKQVNKLFSSYLLKVEKQQMKQYSINLCLNSDNKHFN